MDDDVIQMMGELLVLYGERGKLDAKRLWNSCADPDETSKDGRGLVWTIQQINNKIKKLNNMLDIVLDTEQMNELKTEGNAFGIREKEEKERVLELQHRPTNTTYVNGKIAYGPMNYNKRALINMTDKNIPDDIKIGLSFGWKFLFPFSIKNDNMYEIIAQVDKCIDDTVHESRRMEANIEVANILKSCDNYQENKTTQWLTFISKRTEKFFKNNVDIFATRSDKGGHTVVITVEQYEKEVERMLNNDGYEIIGYDPLDGLIKNESRLIKIIKSNFKCKEFLPLLRGYQPNLLKLACFYGLPKVHKPGLKLRPITALSGGPGYFLGKVFNDMLKVIFPRTEHHIKDSYDIKKFLDQVEILPTNIIKSYDVVNMFPSIPVELAIQTIMEKSKDFLDNYGIGKIILQRILKYLLIDSTFFTAVGKTYKQISGLPMGGCISPTIARLIMDKVIVHLYEKVPEITFIKVFVDDTIAALDPQCAGKALETLNNFNPMMKFTVEDEDENQSIKFLNLNLMRTNGGIKTNWYRKIFASGRLVSFYSGHKFSTIMGTAEAFIKTVLSLSNGEFFHQNRNIVMETLRENCFPDTTIESLMNKFYTLMRPVSSGRGGKNPNVEYKIFPHAINGSARIKKVLDKLKNPNIVLADSTKNTKINHVTTRKTKIEWERRGNIILFSNCQCGEKYRIDATKFNESGKMAMKRLQTSFNRCNNTHAFTEFDYVKGLAYNSQTKYLLKYVKFYYGGRLNNVQADLPNYHLINLLKKSRIPGKIKKGKNGKGQRMEDI